MTARFIKIISLFISAFYFISCPSQAKPFIPVPDSGYFEEKDMIGISSNSITETKNGVSMPEWLRVFMNEGIGAAEYLDRFYNKYVYIGINKGTDPASLNKWAEIFSPVYDFPMLAAQRIEKRMIMSATLYPNDEYGPFFERLVKSSYAALYTGAQKEETFWIRARINDDNYSSSEIFMYFILITIDKTEMQSIIKNMLTQTENTVKLTSAQAASVSRLQQNFFEGF